MPGFNRMSVATIDSPEFVNITSISPLVSKCEIKVLYVGENRNRSVINKQVATEMAQTLPGCPIVGYYIENKEDFGDHGDQIIIDGEGIKFKKLTTPYGFVAPDSKVWFQKFDDTDEFGNVETREYLMTEGYLWTGQFEECKRVLSNGNPQSMELDEKTLKGHWSTDKNRGIDFFIINDATFSKLCILGEDVEPCFEGANVSAPSLSSKFSKNDNFVPTLFSMMKELQETLQYSEGGHSMDNQNTPVVENEFSQEVDKNIETPVVENDNITEEFAKKDDEKDSEKEDSSKEDAPEKEDEEDKKKYAASDDKKKDEEDKEEEDTDEDKKKYAASDDKKKDEEEDKEPSDEKEDDKEEDKKEDDKDKNKYSLLESQYADLQSQYSALEIKYNELLSFKNQIEDKQKDDLIASFYMLSDEDKQDVVENKAKYSLDDIEAKLSVICVRKKVSFTTAEETATEDMPTIYNLGETEASMLPPWLKAVADTKKRNS